jgi:hypothetical protein
VHSIRYFGALPQWYCHIFDTAHSIWLNDWQ